jgi:predicted DNA-binding protein (MmcQ/YjbR family)
MTLSDIRAYCLAKVGASEELPFDNNTPVFKVGGKIFAITNSEAISINLKCDPERALELRASYEAVQPGYHMNKRHWITVLFDGSIPKREIQSWIDDSYTLVVASLPKSKRPALASTPVNDIKEQAPKR